MSREGNFTLSGRSRLTLGQLIIAVGILAFSFAYSTWEFSAALAVTIFGILLLKGLRVPVVTEWGGLWCWLPWVLWCLSLAACPVAILVISNVYPYDGPPPFARTRPWATRLVDALSYAHLGLSAVASMAVVLLVEEGFRWLAWGAIMLMGFFAAYATLCGVMTTTGESL